MDAPPSVREPGPCPSCGARLARLRARNLDLDRCVSCGGIWFDRGELDSYRASHPVQHDSTREWKASGGNARPLRCPRCRTETVASGTALGAPAMQCRSCHGIFVSARLVTELSSEAKPRGTALAEPSVGRSIVEGMTDAVAFDVVDAIVSLFDF